MQLIYFAPVCWASYWQRPHYMIRHLIRQGIEKVTWVDPYPTRLPTINDLARLRQKAAQSVPASETGSWRSLVRVVVPSALPIEPLPLGPAFNRVLFWPPALAELRAAATSGPCLIGIGRPSRLACWALSQLPHFESFYDAMDDFPSFYKGLSARSMARVEQEVACRVTHLLCSAQTLASKFSAMGLQATVIPNGYTMSSLPAPSSLAAREVIGYVGTIGRWFDWPLVLEMACALPSLRIQLIGPEFVPRPVLPSNVEMIPECSQAEAVDHIRKFRVGLIPFLRMPLTESVDPIKYYEYRALGVPVWTTAFGTMSARVGEPGVVAMGADSDWRALATAADAFEDSAEYVETFRRNNDWSSRFETLPFLERSPLAMPLSNQSY